MASKTPARPNILITGTPGTGKTTMAEMAASQLEGGFVHVNIGDIVKSNKFYTKYDEVMDTHVIEDDDEDRLIDYLEPIMMEGGKIVDYHSSELFPERWFALVVVLHASTEVLFDRLSSRGYSAAKREENMDAEISCVCEEEVRDSYKDEVIVVRDNNTNEDMDATIDFIADRLEAL